MILNPLPIVISLSSHRDTESGATMNTIGFEFHWAGKVTRKFMVATAFNMTKENLVMALAQCGAEIVTGLDRCGYLRAMADPEEGSMSEAGKEADTEIPDAGK